MAHADHVLEAQRIPPPAVRRPHSDQPTTKLSRRESRLGLKNIFARSKPAAKEPEPEPAQQTIHAARSTGIRASLAELGHWPHAHHSDAALSSSPPWGDLPVTPDLPHPDPMARHHHKGGLNLKSPKRHRPAIVNGTTIPLFKAFPQAVRHVALPAATISADAILRLNEKKHVISMMDEAAAAVQTLKGGDREREKRKHRRNLSASAENLEWTTKIFVLVTSGYLLQYAGDGHFDRLPEKTLRLGASSAAFASDAIPGRHWVVQVSSAADIDGSPAIETRSTSLLSKLPFRIDRRSTSNLLMVFESANVMDAWISTLRTEIEKLGGKKNLSETGRPRTTESLRPPLQHWHGRHTLAADDATRPHQSTRRRTREVRSSDALARVASPDAAGRHPLEDDSASNSGVSQDEHQLDSLREHSQRYSLISSGQRTVLTSAGPSPEASPTREQADEAPGRHASRVEVVVRPRPNGSDIAIRRQSSMQIAGTFVDSDRTGSQSPSMCGPAFRGDGVTSPAGLYPTPNFSVPQSSNRRYSHARMPLADLDVSLPPPDRGGEPSPGLTRSKPPPAARTTHTLSVVMDQPPPLLEAPPPQRPTTGHGGRRSPAHCASRPRPRSTSRGRETSSANWPADGTAAGRRDDVALSPSLAPPHDDEDEPHRRQRRGRDAKSMPPSEVSMPTDQANSRLSTEPSRPRRLTASPARIQAHASSPHLKVQMTTEKGLLNRRSMPQLLAGPPPAPPPTKALPPIPQNLRVRA
ncbi:hypothetical protein XA68_12132 [Ophiocordyceps unilateralis]|uniref:PH domain-containing protein n=1 Tax=Ophiocordyceps unilateralis TaxID=268505 RepID=A0A2A9PE39_OPHUN|nr:hypothetical protein XA68_12132 [Ophiocordyceps unilateralis]